jgi:hypothetical protein
MRKKEAGKKLKYKGFMYRDITNVEHEMYDYIGDNRSHWNSNKWFKENVEAASRRHSVASLQETTVLGTSQKLRKVLQSET